MRGHIRKRGNKYVIVVDVGRDHNGKRKQKWFSGYERKKDAEKDLPRILNEINHKKFIEPSDMTFGEYMEKWLEKKFNEVSYGTYHPYESYSKNHIIPGLGQWKIKDLKPKHIQTFIDSLYDKDLSKNTVRHILRIIGNAISDGVEYGLSKDLMANIKPIKVPKKKIEYWTEEEMKQFLGHLDGERYFIPIFLAVATGMRQGEVLGLSWEDVDFESQTISVTRQLRKKPKLDDQGRFEITDQLKTPSSYRTISIDDTTLKYLKQHKKEQEDEKEFLGLSYKDYNLVCSTKTGNYILPQNLNRTFWKITERSGVKRIPFHGLRHTHATLLLKKGVHPKIVQERLGHSSIQITLDTYSHIIPGLEKVAAEKIGSIFSEL